MDTVDSMVTGGTGFIGRWLIARLTAGGRGVLAPIRNASKRRRGLLAHVAELGGAPSLLRVVEGDLTREDLALPAALGNDVRDVFHAAGLYAWRLPQELAREVNVAGTLRVLQWAAARRDLRRFVHVGGYRMTRLPPWVPREGPLDRLTLSRMYRRLGAYEASKIESQRALVREASRRGVPLSIVSPATVSGDSRTGETIQFTGLAETFARLWRGQMPVGVGTSESFVPLVTADALSQILATVPENPATVGQQLVVLDPRTPTLPALLREVASHVGVPAPSRTVPKPLVAALPESWTGVVRETLSFVSEDRYDLSETEAHMETMGLSWPERRAATARWMDHLVSTRFGEDPDARVGSFAEVAGSRTFVVGAPDRASVVLLHGLPWDAESWRPLEEVWSVDAARADLPGLGRSTPAAADDVAWLTRLLGSRDDPVWLVGHSYGGGLALRYASAFPEHVAGIVLVGPYFLQPRAAPPLRCPGIASSLLRRVSSTTLARDGRAERPIPSVATRSAVAQLRRPGVASRTAARLREANLHSHRSTLRAALVECQTPCLLIDGEHDPVLHPLPPRPLGERVTIAGASHTPHLTHPRETALAIGQWCTRLGGRIGRPPTSIEASSQTRSPPPRRRGIPHR